MHLRQLIVVSATMLMPAVSYAAPFETAQLFSAEDSAGFAIASFDEAVAAAKASMMGEPNKALENAVLAENLAANATVTDALATSLWLQGEALTRLNKPDEAAPIIERAIAALSGDASKLAGDLRLAQGRIQRVLGQDGAALESFQEAYKIFEPLGVARSQALALQSIGTLYDNAHQYERVIEYYERASEAFSDGAMLDLVSLNNRANAYREMRRFEDAHLMLEGALEMAEQSGSNMLQARILTNVAVLEVRHGELEAAEEAIERGFKKADNDDARGWAPFLWGARSELEFERGNLIAAKNASEKTFEDVELDATPAPFRDFHEAGFKIYSQLGEHEIALAHLSAFKRLDDQGRDVAASANLALMNAEFEFANKELEIEKLRTAELQKNIELAQAREMQGLIIGVGTLTIVFCLLGFMAWAYRSARKSQQATEAFNKKLGTKNEELSATNTALEKANQAKMEFLATTSHEIRTPLNAIIGLSDVVLNGDAIIPQDREYLTMVNSAGKDLLHIVNDILDVSKLESGRLSINKEPVEIGPCLLNVAEIWRKAATEKNLEYVVEVEGDLGSFMTDGRLIRQVASNLISNAIKFTNEGKISVALTKAAGAGFEIKVSDTGIGVAPEQHEEIFEAFKQADGRLQRTYGGTGLGLAICKKITLALGGDTSIDSVLGAGSTFTVDIPAERQDEQSAGATDAPHISLPKTPDMNQSVDLGTLRVLIVEDNATNATVINAFLCDQVARIHIVENGALAVEAVQKEEFDVILMDKQMPVMDGIMATKAIRKLPTAIRDIPIIAVTADAFDGASEHVLRNGMDGFVAKPVEAKILTDAILTALQEKRYAAAS